MQMRYLVHIGYPKAASTWLQKNLFSGRSRHFRPLHDGRNVAYRKSGGKLFYDFIDEIAYVNPYVFDAVGARKKLEAATEGNARVTVLSNEAWCGQPFSGAFGKTLAERIHAVVPEATILIVVRSQPEIILSSYLHYLVKHGGTTRIDEFLRAEHWIRKPAFAPHYFQYIDLIAFYDDLFGREKVVVLPFETIRESTAAFVTPLYEAFQLQPEDNLSSAAENARNLRESTVLSQWPRLNLLESRRARGAALRAMMLTMSERRAERQRQALLDRIHNEVDDYYRTGNRRLEERIGHDLASLGYPV